MGAVIPAFSQTARCTLLRCMTSPVLPSGDSATLNEVGTAAITVPALTGEHYLTHTHKIIARRWHFAAALIALGGLFAFADVSSAEPPLSTSDSPSQLPATESAATMPTTTVTRAPSPSEELNILLMHATFLVVGPTKVPNQIS